MTRAKATPFGALSVCNGVLMALLAATYFANRALGFYHGPANLAEFMLYSLLIFGLSVAGWRAFQRPRPSWTATALIELGILGHVAGGFLPIHGGRLYDVDFLGVGYDHYLHAFNGLAGAVLAASVLPQMRNPLRNVVILLVVLGVGSIVEIVEYGAYVTVNATGVGGYDNNMRDMAANLAGALAFLALQALPARQSALALRREESS